MNYPQITMSSISSSSDESSTSKLMKFFLGAIVYVETDSDFLLNSVPPVEVQLEFCTGCSLTEPVSLRRKF